MCEGGEWEKIENMQINAASKAEMGADTAEECRDLCANDTACMAVDFSSNPQEMKNCQFYHHMGTLEAMNGVIHYRMANCTGGDYLPHPVRSGF